MDGAGGDAARYTLRKNRLETKLVRGVLDGPEDLMFN